MYLDLVLKFKDIKENIGLIGFFCDGKIS
jgi:non-canonical (house-cleaning) NTP pyrophosphatase